jgi:pseudaminic acid biosynthesis-associated methylase
MWEGDFGREYTERNTEDRDALCKRLYGETAVKLTEWFLNGLPRGMKVLEVGCGSGANIGILAKVGIHNVIGVDIQPEAIKRAQEIGWDVVEGDAKSLPFKDGSFDMVFTSGVLIHIPPDDLEIVMGEMLRVSRQYIHGLEYWHPELIEVEYRGQMGLMWKGPYAELWQARGLNLRRYHRLEYKDGSGCVDELYLLEKE